MPSEWLSFLWVDFSSPKAVIAKAIGLLGFIATILIYQQKNKHNTLLWKMITDLLWIVHFLLVGSMTTVATTSVAVFRSFVFMNDKKKWAQSKLWPLAFCVLNVISGLLVWEGPISLLPMTGSLVCILAYWIGKPKLVRLASLPAGILYLAYMLIKLDFEGILNETFIILSALVGLIRFDWRKKVTEAKESPNISISEKEN